MMILYISRSILASITQTIVLPNLFWILWNHIRMSGDQKRIYLWGHIRALTSAFARAMMSRESCKVSNPLYHVYVLISLLTTAHMWWHITAQHCSRVVTHHCSPLLTYGDTSLLTTAHMWWHASFYCKVIIGDFGVCIAAGHILLVVDAQLIL